MKTIIIKCPSTI